MIDISSDINFLDFISCKLHDYMREYYAFRVDIIILAPYWMFIRMIDQEPYCGFNGADNDNFLLFMGCKIHFVSPYEDSIIIFDREYQRGKHIIKIPGLNKCLVNDNKLTRVEYD